MCCLISPAHQHITCRVVRHSSHYDIIEKCVGHLVHLSYFWAKSIAMYSTLISAADLAGHLNHPKWVVLDARFYLNDTGKGRREYEEGHLPGARYVHLDEDLSGPILPGKTGRHPLPDPAKMARAFGRLGISSSVQVVVYDQGGGGIASRAWWLLRWLGHEKAAVLDGGWAHWMNNGLPVTTDIPNVQAKRFQSDLQSGWTVTANEAGVMARSEGQMLVDSREAVRYRGEQEPIDPVAGHIPGAINMPFGENLENGRFLPADVLRRRFEAAGGDTPPESIAFYCGSGVTACHNMLAYAHAGLGMPLLYPGSWSEWITDANRPVARELP